MHFRNNRIARYLSALRVVLATRRAVLWTAAIGVALASLSLGAGLSADDYFLRAAALGHFGLAEVGTPPLACFTFADGHENHNLRRVEKSLHPWWAWPHLNMSFLRPLSAATHWFDFRWLGGAYWLMHVHSLAWYGALCVAASMLYRRMLPLPFIAGLAAVFYAMDDAHGVPVGWLSNRNALLTTLFGVLALLAHDTWRSRSRAWGLPCALMAWSIALGCGEAALAVAGYLFAYALFVDTGTRGRRCLSLAPYAALGVVYLVIYAMGGNGTRGSGLYTDPLGDPGRFLLLLPERLPILLGGQLGLAPANIYVLLSPGWRLAMTAAGLFLALALAWVMWALLRTDRVARFWTLGMLLSLVPVCSAAPTERLLCFSGIGAFGLIAQFVGPRLERWRACGRADRIGVVFLVIVHGVAAPVGMPLASVSATIFGDALERAIASMPSGPDVREKSVVLLNAPVDVLSTLVPTTRIAQGTPIPKHVWELSAGTEPLEVRRIDAYTLELRTETAFLQFPYGTTFRGPRSPFRVGEKVETTGFTAAILDIGPGGSPRAIRFRFNVPLDDPSLLWCLCDSTGLHPCSPPTIGSTMRLPAVVPMDWLIGNRH